MTTFWSVYIIVITLGTIAGCAILLWSCRQNNTDKAEGESMGHSFDGIEEINNPLPKWWTYMFVATIFFALGYLIIYPGLGSYPGLINWKSSEQNIRSLSEQVEATKATKESGGISAYHREIEKAEASFGEVFNKLAYDDKGQFKSIEAISKDKEALKVGKRLFLQNCSQCHGSTAKGGNGFPNLTDKDWLYGGEPEIIKTTIMHGRQGVMPAGGGISRTDQQILELAAYTLSLSGRKVDATEAKAGQVLFAVCSACHGADGKGNQEIGAPNLTDKTWLYGGSRKAVEATIRNGRSGVMPIWGPILGEDKIQLISAYVYSLSKHK